MENLNSSIRELFTNSITSGLGKMLNEPETNIGKALDIFVPTTLAGLFNFSKSASNNDMDDLIQGAQNLLGGTNTNGVSVLENMASGQSDYSYWIARGSAWLKSIFGDKLGHITDFITQNSGMKSSSSSSLMGLVMPFIIDFITQKSGSNVASGFGQLLGKNSAGFLSAIPAGLGISKLFNWAEDKVSNPLSNEPEPKRKSESAWAWLLLLALAGLAVWFFLRGCNKEENTANTENTNTTEIKNTTPTPTPDPTVSEIKGKLENGNWIYDVGNEKEIKLADGTTLRVGENSTEARLFNFLSDANVKVADDKTQGWITLDRVYFETGKDVLVPSSMTQLKNIALILKNFPSAKVKMGGYTDNTGSDDINIPLSDKRAKIAAAEIQKQGVIKDNISAEGYGSQHPVCPANNTDECKAQNRRVDIRVTAK